MSFLDWGDPPHASSNLMMHSACVSKKSKAFSVLISLKSYQASFRLI